MDFFRRSELIEMGFDSVELALYDLEQGRRDSDYLEPNHNGLKRPEMEFSKLMDKRAVPHNMNATKTCQVCKCAESTKDIPILSNETKCLISKESSYRSYKHSEKTEVCDKDSPEHKELLDGFNSNRTDVILSFRIDVEVSIQTEIDKNFSKLLLLKHQRIFSYSTYFV